MKYTKKQFAESFLASTSMLCHIDPATDDYTSKWIIDLQDKIRQVGFKCILHVSVFENHCTLSRIGWALVVDSPFTGEVYYFRSNLVDCYKDFLAEYEHLTYWAV